MKQILKDTVAGVALLGSIIITMALIVITLYTLAGK
jgi:hypothetical protein